MTNSVEYLESVANHFAPRDWNYTRKTGIRDIRYTDPRPTSLLKRLESGFSFLFRSKKWGIIYDNKLRMRAMLFFYHDSIKFKK